MRIVLFTFYFAPDLCAGSFRNTALIKSLQKFISHEDHVDVITTMPNRYSSFKAAAPTSEKYTDNIHIYRIPLPEHKSGFLDQMRSFIVYYFGSHKRVRMNPKYDVVLASSSRLFTAYLGARVSKKQNIPLYLDIRDLFRDTINDVIGNKLWMKPISWLIRKIENYTFKSADHINMVSEGFRAYLEKFSNQTSFFPNGIDSIFTETNFIAKPKENSKIIITYAGNIGDGQGLHKIIPNAARRLYNSNYYFRIIGDGGALDSLKMVLDQNSVKNVEVIEPVSRDKLIDYYKETNILFLHLNDYDAFKKVLPSKIFEYAATGKPILAGVGGYAREFMEKYVKGVSVFEPCDDSKLAQILCNGNLKPSYIDREEFINMFSREAIMDRMSAEIVNKYRYTNV